MNRFLLIGAGAVLGANARYLVGLWAAGRFGAGLPYGTFIVNATGSLALGFIAASVTGRISISAEARLLLGIGLLGSFTTFSSFSVETLALLQNGSPWAGILNIVANNVIGLSGALVGVYLARLVG